MNHHHGNSHESSRASANKTDEHHSSHLTPFDQSNTIPSEYLTSQGETAKEVEDRLRMLIHDLRSPLLLLKMLFTKLETELKHQAETAAAGKTYSHLRALPGMEALARTGYECFCLLFSPLRLIFS